MKTAYVIRFVQMFSLRLVFSTDFVVRETKNGPVRGFTSERIHGTIVEEFLGIPYASPPVGDLRFERPVPPKSWTSPRDALELSSACIQYDSMDYINEHSPGFYKSSEDCLYINVYTPKLKSANDRIPVLLYVHGGSNRAGMGSMLSGDILAGQGQIVVVTFNYRLGIFGFLAAKDEGLEGTYGFHDQIEVFKWVQLNIGNFGGDPDSVTIHGHSAGAADVGFHILSPLSKGYFKRAIIHSGSPLGFWATTNPKWPIGYNVQPEKMTENPIEISFKEYMKQKRVEDIRTIQGMSTARDTVTYPAVVDGYFLEDRPEALLRQGLLNGKQFMISFARDEGFPIEKHFNISRYSLDDIKYILAEYKKIYGDVCNLTDVLLEEYKEFMDAKPLFRLNNQIDADLFFFSPIIKLAQLMSEVTNDLYLLSFNHLSSLSNQHKWQGIPHGIDLFYVFGVPLVGHPKVNYTELDKKASRAAMKVYSDFVKTGSLIFEEERYMSYKRFRQVYHRLLSCDNNIMMDSMFNLRQKRMTFWNDILPSIKCTNDNVSGEMENLMEMKSNGQQNLSAEIVNIILLCIIKLIFNYL